MFKRISIALLCLPLLGLGIIPISGRRDAAPPAGNIEDDFSGDLSKWTMLTNQTGGPPRIDSGEYNTRGEGVSIYTDEQTSTISQWVLFKYAGDGGDPNYAGSYFRSTNNASEYAYCLRVTPQRDLYWRDCLGHSCANIDIYVGTISDGDYVGLEVTGTGNDTEVAVWDFDGTPPANRASWGTATDTLDSDPNNAADVGKYVGLYDGASADDLLDNFSAGDI